MTTLGYKGYDNQSGHEVRPCSEYRPAQYDYRRRLGPGHIHIHIHTQTHLQTFIQTHTYFHTIQKLKLHKTHKKLDTIPQLEKIAHIKAC